MPRTACRDVPTLELLPETAELYGVCSRETHSGIFWQSVFESDDGAQRRVTRVTREGDKRLTACAAPPSGTEVAAAAGRLHQLG